VTDPRLIRTQQELFAALDSLLAEKPFTEINVSELTKRANVGRQTFYRHFKSVGDMLAFRLHSNLAEQMEIAKADESAEAAANWPLWVCRYAFQRVAEQPHISRAILSGEAGANALAAFRDQIMALNESAPDHPYSGISPTLKKYVSAYHAGAVVAVLLQWIDSDCSPDVETMSRFVADFNDTSNVDWNEIGHKKKHQMTIADER